MSTLLTRLGLGRRPLVAWACYDWANSVFMTSVIQVFPIYFAQVAAAGQPLSEATRRFSLATTVGAMLIAVLAPVLGAIADRGRLKKKMLGGFLALGVLATAGLFWVGKGDWLLGSALFVLGNVGITGTLVFYDSLLPHIAERDELDRVATAGFALGYLGGGLLFALNILWIQQPHWFGIPDDVTAIRLSFLSASIWWLVFSIPLFLYVPEPAAAAAPAQANPGALILGAFANLRRTFSSIARYRNAFLFLLAFMLFSDGISTIIRMGTIFGTELGIPRGALIGSVLMVQFVGVPCAFGFGALAGRIGTKPAIYLALVVYLGITLLAFFMTTAFHFFLLAFLVALVQGGSQALSRSLFATLIPRERSSEFYGFFGVFEKFGAVFGPVVFTLLLQLTGSSRLAVLALAAFFLAGGAVLSQVDVEAGRRAAAAEGP